MQIKKEAIAVTQETAAVVVFLSGGACTLHDTLNVCSKKCFWKAASCETCEQGGLYFIWGEELKDINTCRHVMSWGGCLWIRNHLQKVSRGCKMFLFWGKNVEKNRKRFQTFTELWNEFLPSVSKQTSEAIKDIVSPSRGVSCNVQGRP